MSGSAIPWAAARQFPHPSLSPRVCSHSCQFSQWCSLTISSSAAPFSFCLQFFPASGCFLMSQLFTSGGQKYWSFSISPFERTIQGWFLLGLIGLISLQPRRLSRVFTGTLIWKHQFFTTQPSLWSNSHIHTCLVGKKHSFDYTDLCQQSDVSAF